MTAEEREVIAQAIHSVARSLTGVAHGGVQGPAGLEALAFAIAGEGLKQPLAESLSTTLDELATNVESLDSTLDVQLDRVATALDRFAVAHERLAVAVEQLSVSVR